MQRQQEQQQMQMREQKLYKLFDNQLRQTLAFAKQDQLTFQQLYVVLYEARIRLADSLQAQKLKQCFQDSTIPLRQIYHLFVPIKYQIIHNVPSFVVKLVNHNLGHRPQICFQWWKTFMDQKYGNQLRWFDLIAKETQSRRIKSFLFKQNLRVMLQNTEHKNCASLICQKFPKNTRNQIQWTTFMAVVRHNPNKYGVFKQKSPKSKGIGMKEKRMRRTKTQHEAQSTIGVWSHCSLQKSRTKNTERTRCHTPNPIKISFLKNQSKKKVKQTTSLCNHNKIKVIPFKTRYIQDSKKYRFSTQVIHTNYEGLL